MRHIEKERLLLLDRIFNMTIRFKRQCFRKKDIGPVILFQMRNLALARNALPCIVFFSIITAGLPCREPADIHIKPEVQWISSLVAIRTEMSLADMNGPVS